MAELIEMSFGGKLMSSQGTTIGLGAHWRHLANAVKTSAESVIGQQHVHMRQCMQMRQHPSNVILIFPHEKSSLSAMWPFVKILLPLVLNLTQTVQCAYNRALPLQDIPSIVILILAFASLDYDADCLQALTVGC